MLIAQDRFSQEKTIRVKLLIDQKINGAAGKAGEECFLSLPEANRLRSIGRVEYVLASTDDTPKKATR